VAFVSQAFVQRWFGGGAKPVGREMRVHLPGGAPLVFTIASVAGDVVHDFTDRGPLPIVYVPLAQAPPAAADVLVRTAQPIPQAIPAARRALAAVDARTPMQDPGAYSQLIRNSVLGIGYIATMMSISGGVALFLAALGLFGLLAQNVNERIRELGIRMALGAGRDQVARLVLASGFRLTLFGLALGLPAAFALARLLWSLLFGVSADDLFVFLAVPLLLLAVTALAVLAPLRRVLNLDPVLTLRHE
jgi:putative ABC transport system permease protein